MKMKARDIIPGWPQSHSTMARRDTWTYRRIFYAWFGWTEADMLKDQREFWKNSRYHEDQQKMVDDYRRVNLGNYIDESLSD